MLYRLSLNHFANQIINSNVPLIFNLGSAFKEFKHKCLILQRYSG